MGFFRVATIAERLAVFQISSANCESLAYGQPPPEQATRLAASFPFGKPDGFNCPDSWGWLACFLTLAMSRRIPILIDGVRSGGRFTC